MTVSIIIIIKANWKKHINTCYTLEFILCMLYIYYLNKKLMDVREKNQNHSAAIKGEKNLIKSSTFHRYWTFMVHGEHQMNWFCLFFYHIHYTIILISLADMSTKETKMYGISHALSFPILWVCKIHLVFFRVFSLFFNF